MPAWTGCQAGVACAKDRVAGKGREAAAWGAGKAREPGAVWDADRARRPGVAAIERIVRRNVIGNERSIK